MDKLSLNGWGGKSDRFSEEEKQTRNALDFACDHIRQGWLSCRVPDHFTGTRQGFISCRVPVNLSGTRQEIFIAIIKSEQFKGDVLIMIGTK